MAFRTTTPVLPLQSFLLRIELDTTRHRFMPRRLCGRLGIQSFLDLPVVPYLIQHSLYTLRLSPAP
jgi:hypothetical protein